MISRRAFLAGVASVAAMPANRAMAAVDATAFGLSTAAPFHVNDAAIHLAAAALGPQGGKVVVPAGKFAVGDLDIPQRGVELWGETRYSTMLNPVIPVGDVLTLSGWDTAVRHLSIVSDGFRDEGANIALSGHRAEVEDVFISNDVLGIRMTGIAAKIRDTYLHTGKGGGVRIEVGGGDTTQIIDGVLIGAQNAPQPFAGIMVRHSSALTISNTSVLTAGYGLLVNPGSYQLVTSLMVSNSFFDNCRKGMFVSPAPGGGVSKITMDKCWFGSSIEAGVSITSDGYQFCEGFLFDGCDFIKNGGSGLEVANTRGLRLVNNRVAANLHGFWFATGCRNFTVNGNHIGQYNGETANNGWAVVLDANTDIFQITNNNMVGNGAGKILGFSPSSYRVENNNVG